MASKLLHLQGPYSSTREFKPPLRSSCAHQNSLAKVLQSSSGGQDFLSPPLTISTRRDYRYKVRALTISSLFNAPLIAPQNQLGNWTALVAISAFGIWSKKTKIGKVLSGAMVSTLVGLAAANLGIVSSDSETFNVALDLIVPLAVPLLLYRAADLRRVINSTGALFFAFLLGTVATTVGTLLVFLIVPVLGHVRYDWKVAAAVMSGNIGGAANGVAISNALGIWPSDFAAGLATHYLICAVFFTTMLALAFRIPSEASTSDDGVEMDTKSLIQAETPAGTEIDTKSVIEAETLARVQMDTKYASSDSFPVLQTARALAVSLAICKLGSCLTTYFGFQGGSVPAVIAITVVLANIFPKKFEHLEPSGEAMAMILMQLYFTVVGARANIWTVIYKTPSIFILSLLQLAIHLVLILGLGKLFRFDLKMLLVASNANVGGPMTACGMATAKEWTSMVAPGILVGFFGCAISTPLVTLFGEFLKFFNFSFFNFIFIFKAHIFLLLFLHCFLFFILLIFVFVKRYS